LPAQEDAPSHKQCFDLKDLFSSHPQGQELVKVLGQFEEVLMTNLNFKFKQGFAFNSFQNELKSWHDHIIKKIISEALETTYGNQIKAAEILNITPRALRYYLKEKQKPC
jgi:DNA-binding NtrC family response regulator